MTSELEVGLYIFMLAGFLGYHIITRVPPLLHTPLMSATNAIAAISLVGSLVVAGSDYSDVPNGWVCTLLGFIAVTCSATNAVGGFLITDRMLRMFKTAEERTSGDAAAGRAAGARGSSLAVVAAVAASSTRRSRRAWRWREYLHDARRADDALRYCYIVSAAMFVLGLKGLSSPKWARRACCSRPSACSSPSSARSSTPTSSPTAGSRSACRSARWSAARWASASR